MTDFSLSPSSKPVRDYHATLLAITGQGAVNEGAVRDAFAGLLREVGKKNGLTLLAEQTIGRKNGRIRVDGVLNDANRYPFGYWEAKDTRDDLETEIAKKIGKDYPLQNIIFEDTRQAVLYQNKRRVGAYDLTSPAEVAQLLTLFFNHTEPAIDGFNDAVRIFNERVPEHAQQLRDIIAQAHRENKKFQAAFDGFMAVVRESLNPALSSDEVDEMLIQHLLTERIIATVFDLPEFTRRNVIAAEVEKVIDALTSRHFNKRDFLGKLDFFYKAIENAARTLDGFTEKQAFLNTVYERFFQGFAVKTADVLGIVYTPQEIVDFMGAAVEEVLVQDFGLSLAHPDVHIIDPCTGTGGFVVNLLKRLDERHKPALREVYANRLFANEVALMPYYIAALNIEQTYRDLTGEYAPFEGLCLVDTLGLADDDGKLALFAEENTERIQRQRSAPITVIIGNPPYNVGQQNENDNNKNRRYPAIDKRVKDTYVKDSKATLRAQVYDAYVKFWRWATDRLAGRDGVVVYVTNNSFADQIAFDGMRKHLLQDFTHVYHLDLHGNVRQNPKLSGTTHNVFGIQVGVGVTVAVKSARHTERKLFYHRVPEFWTAGQKLAWIADHVEREGRENSLNTVPWTMLTPDAKNNWQVAENADEFSGFMAMGTKEGKAAKGQFEPEVMFKSYSNGVKTNRDDTVYDFDQNSLLRRMERFTEVYNSHVDKFKRQPNNKNIDIDDFVDYSAIKWDGSLKDSLIRGMYGLYNSKHARTGLYRPFSKKNFYFDRLYINRVYLYPAIFPSEEAEKENRVICVSGISSSKPFQTLISNAIPSLDTLEKTQCFPFYVYDEDGGNRRENITDWALRQFQAHYADPSISKWDIFYTIYALLHHPVYRARYQAALKKELPRIPFVPDFHAFARIGKTLAELHLNYETAAPYPLTETWASGRPADWRVEKMKFSKDKSALTVNPSLTLSGFPAAAFAYTLGGRSALDWVVEQYQVKTDARSGIVSDPNRYSDDETYIVELIKRVTTVSVETVRLVGELPGLG